MKDNKQHTPSRREQCRQKAKRVKEIAYAKTPQKFKNASSFQIRLRTGVIYVAVAVSTILAGNFATMAFLSITAGLCAAEFYYMLRNDAKMPNEWIGVIGAALLTIAAYVQGLKGMMGVILAIMLVLTVWYVFWRRARIADVGGSIFGFLYTGGQLAGIMLLRRSFDVEWAGFIVLVIFISIWANDVGAYLIGRTFGKHRLAPHTSPNKTWEGFIAGLVCSALSWCLLLFVPDVHFHVAHLLFIGFVAGLCGVLGDLCESRIKRSVGFKDSGTIMPGHGGLFDRCDSLMTAATASVMLLTLLGYVQLV